MKNPFALSDEKLKILLDGYTAWCKNNPKEEIYAIDEENKRTAIKEYLLNRDYIEKASEDELIDKVLEYSRTLEGPANIRIGKPRVTHQLTQLKKNLLFVMDSAVNPFEAATKILKGDFKIDFFSKAFWTPIFQAQYPELLPNWNNKSERFLKNVGIDLKTSRRSIEEKYRLLSDAFIYLQGLDPKLNFHHINHLMHYGTVIEEGKKLLKELLNSNGDEVSYWQIAPGEGARLWQDFRAGSIVAVGWNEIKHDLQGKPKAELESLMEEAYPDWENRKRRLNTTQLWNFMNLKAGDKVITNRGKSELLGLAVVKSGYRYRPTREEYRHTADVEFYRISEKSIPIPDRYRGKFGKTIVPLNKEEFDELEKLFSKGPIIVNKEYPLEQCAQETGFSLNILMNWCRAIERKGQVIFYGPPGTGKTFAANRLAKHLVSGSDGIIELVQFHPAYAYEDFIQGIRPINRADGSLEYKMVPGRFLDFCGRAASRTGTCVFIVDEINRANLARVFGELMYLLEYRGEKVPLAGGNTLKIPENVRIIGTMNTADRSIALVDHALRRRFAFLSLYPDYNILRNYHKTTNFNADPLIHTLERLNRQIGDRHYEVGISFFLKKDLPDHIEDIWQMEIEPYLEEYFFDQPDKADEFRWGKVGKEILS